jgi:hypothetical protein
VSPVEAALRRVEETEPQLKPIESMGLFEETEPVPEWQYSRINLNEVPRRTDDIDLLNDAGKEGWELVSITTNNIAFLKRQIGEPARAQPARRKTVAARTQET